MDLKAFVREVKDFPKKGVVFRDITPLLSDKHAFSSAIEHMTAPFSDKKIDVVVGPESRGFIFGSAVALQLGAGFVPVRKKGKLPGKTISQAYELEYGTAEVEMHSDAVVEGQLVLIVDDVIATGGTIAAVKDMVERSGGVIAGFSFLLALDGLNGTKKLHGYPVFSLLHY